MENLYLKSDDELQEYIKKHTKDCIGFGREGNCILTDNGYVLKKLYGEYNPQFALQFKNIENDSFIFAKSGIFIDDYIRAIFMRYAKGLTLSDKIPKDKSFIQLGIQLQKLVDDIVKLSEMGIQVKDFHMGNIVYDENKFTIIDTIGYLYLRGSYKTENLREIMHRLFYYLLVDILRYREIPNNLVYYGKIDILESPNEYLIKLKKYIENLVEQDVTTVDDAIKVLNKKYGKY